MYNISYVCDDDANIMYIYIYIYVCVCVYILTLANYFCTFYLNSICGEVLLLFKVVFGRLLLLGYFSGVLVTALVTCYTLHVSLPMFSINNVQLPSIAVVPHSLPTLSRSLLM